MKTLLRSTLLILTVQLFSFSAFPQGSLTPPAAPTPTMKTLTQVEPRTDVATLSGDSSNLYIISQPGSYYLSGNITGVASKNGISIQANNVTLDLHGFAVTGAASSFSGIVITNPQTNVTVRNGTVTGWPQSCVTDVSFTTNNASFEQLQLSGTTGSPNAGLLLIASGCVVKDCVSTANTNDAQGFQVRGSGNIFTNCTAYSNSAHGFYIINSSGNTFINCAAYGNGSSSGFVGNGFFASATGGHIFTNCNAYNNFGYGFIVGSDCTITECNATVNSSGGISCGDGAKISHCTASGTTGNGFSAGVGISVGNSAVVGDCSSRGNAGAGITVGFACHVHDCAVRDNGGVGITGGIVVQVSRCVVGSNGGVGISLGDTALVDHCDVNANGQPNTNQNGIAITNFSVVRDCTSDFHQGAAGIYVSGSKNRIEANNVTRNNYGIQVAGSGNFILRNTASGNGSSNTQNYNIAASNRYGAIIDDTAMGAAAVNGNSAASSANSTDPWANFSY
jgi:parallel beta-helix repeat protein